MGQILHGSGKTTHAVRVLIQRSKASNAASSRELGVRVRTGGQVAQAWQSRKRFYGSKNAHTPVLSIDEEAVMLSGGTGFYRCWMAAFMRYSPALRI